MTTETTTTETPVSATQLAEAQQAYADADAWLRDPENDRYVTGAPERQRRIDAKIASHGVIHRATARQPAAPTMTPTERVAAIAARRTTTAALMAEDQGTEMNHALVDVAIEQSAALHAGDAIPGAFTDADVDRAWRDAGVVTETDLAQIKAAMEKHGVSNLESARFAWSIRDATREPELTPEDRLACWSAWWPDDVSFEANQAAFARGWNQLSPADHEALIPFLRNRGVVERIIAFGRRGQR